MAEKEETKTEAKAEDNKKLPAKKIRIGNVTATVWLNDAKSGKFYNINVVRNWKDDKDEWHQTSDYTRNDLPKVQTACMQAYEWLFSEEASKGLETAKD